MSSAPRRLIPFVVFRAARERRLALGATSAQAAAGGLQGRPSGAQLTSRAVAHRRAMLAFARQVRRAGQR